MRAVKPKTSATKPAAGGWRERFRFDHVRVLVVCRGPVRLEAVAAFDAMGAQPTGMLLSEKDSVVFRRALAPELRLVGRNERVHHIPDYGAAGAGEKATRIGQILAIARDGGYTHIFAGYGFMAEDHDFIQAVERAGLGFVGPSAAVVRIAGAKDAAKNLARGLGVSVTPGVDNVLALALLGQAKAGREAAHLQKLVRSHGLAGGAGLAGLPLAEAAERVLAAALAKGVELVDMAGLQREARRQVGAMLKQHPGQRLRLKHVGGGGGKGQRIVARADEVPQAVLEVLNEARATGPRDNRNFLIELNVEETRHNEIQLLGNGKWCIALGGRDCSLQMHEQKLLEVSITEELLLRAAEQKDAAGQTGGARALRQDLAVFKEMEAEAERTGAAVGLDSVSTFESIVSGARHYFMEINTRIQVEHRVTEMVYSLRFANPEDPAEHFTVESLVEAMLWVAVHGARLPRPERVERHGSGAEVRINATNDALQPHAGGEILAWTPPIEHEIRDDQGIGIANPDTGTFMPYHLAGAYDSNAALVVSHGESRRENFERLAEILRRMEVRGNDVMLNRQFHLGLLHWMLGAEPMVKPTTAFVQAYLAAVGALKNAGREVELEEAWRMVARRTAARGAEAERALASKVTLILRPLRLLYGQPHLLAGWLAPRRPRRWEIEDGQFHWRQNPLQVLEQLYLYLRLEEHPGVSPEEQIWEPDRRLLRRGLDFYRELAQRLGQPAAEWEGYCARMERPAPPKGMAKPVWDAFRAAHRG
ncbi:MAG: biotin carboxylase N-terminal domain-containing protein, partial [bacterium]